MKSVVVTASDRNYFFLLQGLIGSMGKYYPEMPIIVIDCLSYYPGSKYLSVKQKAWLKRYPNVTVRRDKDTGSQERFYRQSTWRARLPELFPGFETYIWLDADVWLQTPDALENYILGARDFDVATIADCDRNTVLTKFGAGSWRYKMLLQFYGEKEARRLADLPILFNGNFSARADSKFWATYKQSLVKAIASSRTGKMKFGFDLLAFCHACYMNKLNVGLLPFRSGYVVGCKLPRIDANGNLVEAYPPYDVIDVLHIAGNYKWKKYMLQTTYGKEKVERDLIWPETFDPTNVI